MGPALFWRFDSEVEIPTADFGMVHRGLLVALVTLQAVLDKSPTGAEVSVTNFP